MKKKVLLIVIFIIILIMQTGCTFSEKKQLTTEQKVEDFNQLYNTLKKEFPLFDVQKNVYGVDWLKNKDKYLKEVKRTRSDAEFVDIMNSIVCDLKQGHTNVLDKKGLKNNVVVYNNFGYTDIFNDKKVLDRYNVNKNDLKVKKQKNSEISFINSGDVFFRDKVEKKVGYIRLKRMESRQHGADRNLKNLKRYIKGMDRYKALIIDIRGNGGGSDSFWIDMLSMLTHKKLTFNGYTLFKNSENIKKYIGAKCRLDNKNLNEFLIDINNIPDSIYKNLSRTFVSKYSYYINDQINIEPKPVSKFRGKIYLLTDKDVYSSADTMAIFCKETKFATIVGESTMGGGGDTYPLIFKLNNSGLVVRFVSGMYISQSGVIDEEYKVKPDYKIQSSKCVDRVLDLLKNR